MHQFDSDKVLAQKGYPRLPFCGSNGHPRPSARAEQAALFLLIKRLLVSKRNTSNVGITERHHSKTRCLPAQLPPAR